MYKNFGNVKQVTPEYILKPRIWKFTVRFDSYDPILYDAAISDNLTNIIPNLPSYAQMPLKARTTEGGITYGVPSVGVTHGIYYQKSIFTKYNIPEPATWDEFIIACETLLLAGETVIAQGVADNPWTINRTMKLSDANFIEPFKTVNSLKKYFPQGFGTLGYEAAKQMFALGKAVMFIGG